MNKKEYINELKEVLQDHQVNENDINDVLLDYSQMYDDALDRGLVDSDVYKLLGRPEVIIRELRDTLTLKKQKEYNNKLVALSPFVAVITFMVIGLTTNVYHPTWLIFFIIPMTAIILNTRNKDRIVSLSPFIAVIIFILIGYDTGIYHPTWLIFLIIPISAIIFNTKKDARIISLSPFLALIFFIGVGLETNVWNPTWLIFFIIPIISLLYMKNSLKKILYLGSILVSIAFYLYMGYVHNSWPLGALGFILPLLVGIAYGEIQIINIPNDTLQRKKAVILYLVIIFSIVVFVALGIFLTGWAYAWMVFLLIPMASIYLFAPDKKLTPFMPFIAVIIFFSVGYFFQLFELSWIAFFLIPIVAVIENA